MKIPLPIVSWSKKFARGDISRKCPYPFHGADYADQPETSRIRQSFSEFKDKSFDYFTRFTPRSSKSSINSWNAEAFGDFNISSKSRRNVQTHTQRLRKKFRNIGPNVFDDLQEFDNISISSNMPPKLTLKKRLFHRGTIKMQQQRYEQREEIKKSQQESLLTEALHIRIREIIKAESLENQKERYYVLYRKASQRAKEELRKLSPSIVRIINQLSRAKSKKSTNSLLSKKPSVRGKSHPDAQTENEKNASRQDLVSLRSNSISSITPTIFSTKSLTEQNPSQVVEQLERKPSLVIPKEVKRKSSKNSTSSPLSKTPSVSGTSYQGVETENKKKHKSVEHFALSRSDSGWSNALTLRNDNENMPIKSISSVADQLEGTLLPAQAVKIKKIKRRPVPVTEPEKKEPSELAVNESGLSASDKRSSLSSIDTIFSLPRSNSSSSSRTAASSGSIGSRKRIPPRVLVEASEDPLSPPRDSIPVARPAKKTYPKSTSQGYYFPLHKARDFRSPEPETTAYNPWAVLR